MTDKRQEFTAKVKAQAFQRCGGKCEHCSKKLLQGDFDFDHKISDKILRDHGISSTNLENCQVLCVACHKIETRRDLAEIVKRRKQLKRAGEADGRGAVRGDRPTDKKKSQWQKQAFKKAPDNFNQWTRKWDDEHK